MTVSNASGTSSANFVVNAAQADGTAVIKTPLFLDTGSSGGKYMVIRNDDAAVTAGPSLIISNTLAGSGVLKAQTNTLRAGLSANWGDYPGGTSSPMKV